MRIHHTPRVLRNAGAPGVEPGPSDLESESSPGRTPLLGLKRKGARGELNPPPRDPQSRVPPLHHGHHQARIDPGAEGEGFEPSCPVKAHSLATRPGKPYPATFLRDLEWTGRGIEPRPPGCRPGVFPLDQPPIEPPPRESSPRESNPRLPGVGRAPLPLDQGTLTRVEIAGMGVEPILPAQETRADAGPSAKSQAPDSNREIGLMRGQQGSRPPGFSLDFVRNARPTHVESTDPAPPVGFEPTIPTLTRW